MSIEPVKGTTVVVQRPIALVRERFCTSSCGDRIRTCNLRVMGPVTRVAVVSTAMATLMPGYSYLAPHALWSDPARNRSSLAFVQVRPYRPRPAN